MTRLLLAAASVYRAIHKFDREEAAYPEGGFDRDGLVVTVRHRYAAALAAPDSAAHYHVKIRYSPRQRCHDDPLALDEDAVVYQNKLLKSAMILTKRIDCARSDG